MQAHKKKLMIDIYLHLMPLQRMYNWLWPSLGQADFKTLRRNKKGHLHNARTTWMLGQMKLHTTVTPIAEHVRTLCLWWLFKQWWVVYHYLLDILIVCLFTLNLPDVILCTPHPRISLLCALRRNNSPGKEMWVSAMFHRPFRLDLRVTVAWLCPIVIPPGSPGIMPAYLYLFHRHSNRIFGSRG